MSQKTWMDHIDEDPDWSRMFAADHMERAQALMKAQAEITRNERAIYTITPPTILLAQMHLQLALIKVTRDAG